MTIKERVTNLLDQTQPLGYEMRLVKALLSAKMSQLGQPIAISTVDRYLEVEDTEAGKLPSNFLQAVFEVTQVELSPNPETAIMDRFPNAPIHNKAFVK